LKIVDDGVGFDIGSAAHGRSLGVTSMRERIRLIGGRLTVHSRLGEGTSIEATAPISGA
jgi:two-component system, NarL family, sensor kinase